MSGFARVENSGSEVGAERGLSIRWVRRKSDHGPRYTIPHTQHPSETALTHALSSSEHARPGQEQTEADQGAFRGRPIHAYAGQSRFRWACQHELADGALPWQTSAAGRGSPSSATAVSDQSRRTLLRREDFRDQAGSRCSHSELNVPPVRRSRHTVRRARFSKRNRTDSTEDMREHHGRRRSRYRCPAGNTGRHETDETGARVVGRGLRP